MHDVCVCVCVCVCVRVCVRMYACIHTHVCVFVWYTYTDTHSYICTILFHTWTHAISHLPRIYYSHRHDEGIRHRHQQSRIQSCMGACETTHNIPQTRPSSCWCCDSSSYRHPAGRHHSVFGFSESNALNNAFFTLSRSDSVRNLMPSQADDRKFGADVYAHMKYEP